MPSIAHDAPVEITTRLPNPYPGSSVRHCPACPGGNDGNPAYKSDFIEGFVEQGIAQGIAQGIEQGIARGIELGRVQGKAEDLLKVFAARGLHLSQKQRDRVKVCRDLDQLDQWFDRALTAGTVDEVFGS